MATTSEDILEQLLSLPVETRARLADQLLESLEPGDEKVRELWAEEAERRLDAFERGETKAIPAAEVFAKYRNPS